MTMNAENGARVAAVNEIPAIAKRELSEDALTRINKVVWAISYEGISRPEIDMVIGEVIKAYPDQYRLIRAYAQFHPNLPCMASPFTVESLDQSRIQI